MCHFLTPFRAFENTVKDFIRRHFVHFRSAEPLREAFYPFSLTPPTEFPLYLPPAGCMR